MIISLGSTSNLLLSLFALFKKTCLQFAIKGPGHKIQFHKIENGLRKGCRCLDAKQNVYLFSNDDYCLFSVSQISLH